MRTIELRPTWWGGAGCSLPKNPPRSRPFGHQSSPSYFLCRFTPMYGSDNRSGFSPDFLTLAWYLHNLQVGRFSASIDCWARSRSCSRSVIRIFCGLRTLCRMSTTHDSYTLLLSSFLKILNKNLNDGIIIFNPLTPTVFIWVEL